VRKSVAALILVLQSTLVAACAGDKVVQPTPARTTTIDCGSAYPGPWTNCPEADWTRQFVERAGYTVIGGTGSALLAVGHGYEFSVWTTSLDRPPRQLADQEGWDLLARVRSVEVYGDAKLWRWWAAQGQVVWIHAGLHEDSLPPPPEELGPLISESQALPPPARHGPLLSTAAVDIHLTANAKRVVTASIDKSTIRCV
jgi:hypothetical protein